jgi:hypothetical protein
MEVSGQLQAPAALPLKETGASVHCIVGRVDLRAGLDAVAEIEPRSPSP